MIEAIAWNCVPNELPPEVEPWLQIAAEQAGLDERSRRAFIWANWLLSQVKSGPALSTALTSSFPGARILDITSGFIPISTSPGDQATSMRARYLPYIDNARKVTSLQNRDRVWTFGIVVAVEPREGQATEPLEAPSAIISPGGFPIICEMRTTPLEEHGPANPMGAATSACFVRPRSGKRFYSSLYSEGILIARHVLGGATATAGTLVSMQSGPALTVVDVDGSTTIDAAVLDSAPGPMHPGSNAIPLYQATGPGTKVSVYGSNGTFTADVLRVMDDKSYFGNMMAHRTVIDAHGSHGDSGALVRETSSQDAVGLYIGELPGPPTEGLVQSIRQVIEYFELEIWD